MDTTNRAGTPLRHRMLDDMRMRKLEPRTQEAYVRAVRKLAAYLKRSPDTATVEDLRNFQLHLVDTGTSPITLNATLTGLKFFFDTTLVRIELMARMQPVKVPRMLPVVLSTEEVSRLIAAARNIKHQAALSVAYGAGLRASEVISLKVTDVDSQRMTLRVEQGKGAKDRYAMLSPVRLQRLRTWWRVGHAQGKMLPGGWLFPGMAPMDPLTPRQLNRAVHDAASAAGIERGVSFRWKDYRAKGKTRYKAMTLSPQEFMRRFLLHVLPGGFHRIRHYGLLANGSRKVSLALARELLQVGSAPAAPIDKAEAAVAQQPTASPPTFVCRHCGHAMSIVLTFVRGEAIRAPPSS